MAQDETTFGALLRRYRLAATLSQEALAERAGISADTVRALERGRHGAPQPETLAQLAAALGLTAADRATLVAAATARQTESARPGSAVPVEGPGAGTLAGTAPGAGAAPAPRHNLPTPISALVGREREQAAVLALLRTARLVTLVGTGGVGKTRLALAAASAAVERYRDGIWLVELAPLTDPALVPAAAAAALGVREEPGRPLPATLREALRERELLLLLDNCEHLVAACAELAQGLLTACPQVRLLASSREPLGLPGEQRYRVPSLSTPDRHRLPAVELAGSFEAVRLFVARARERVPAFSLEGPEARAVMEVCARLDGIPLAIELAAAWAELLPVEGIAARLDDRFALLTKGARTALPRQRTLRAALDWSWDLLDAPERALLGQLSVFAGGWALAAARAVCAVAAPGGDEWALLRGLAALEERSLLVREEQQPPAAVAGEGRYRLLETVRQYAAERLAATGEATATRDRHLAYYLALAEAAAPALTGPEQGRWLDRLEEEHDDLRAALGWAMGADPAPRGHASAASPLAEESARAALGLRLATALWRFWWVRGHLSEGRRWLDRALGATPPLSVGAAGRDLARARAQALTCAGALASEQGALERASELHAESLALFRDLGDQPGIATALNGLGGAAHARGNFEQATALHAESLAVRRTLGDRLGVANSLNNLGYAAHAQQDFVRASELHAESLAVYRDLGHTWGIAMALRNLGNAVYEQGDLERAGALLEESLALRRALGDQRGLAITLNNLGFVAHGQGDFGWASALLKESVALCRKLGDGPSLADGLEGLALIAADPANPAGAPRRGALLLAAAAALRSITGAPVPPSDQERVQRAREQAQAALGAASFAAAWTLGETLPLEEVLAAALAAGADPVA